LPWNLKRIKKEDFKSRCEFNKNIGIKIVSEIKIIHEFDIRDNCESNDRKSSDREEGKEEERQNARGFLA